MRLQQCRRPESQRICTCDEADERNGWDVGYMPAEVISWRRLNVMVEVHVLDAVAVDVFSRGCCPMALYLLPFRNDLTISTIERNVQTDAHTQRERHPQFDC